MEKALNKSSKNYELEKINSVMGKYIKVFKSMYMYMYVIHTWTYMSQNMYVHTSTDINENTPLEIILDLGWKLIHLQLTQIHHST